MALACVAATALAGCSGSGSPSSDQASASPAVSSGGSSGALDALVKAAKAEGQVTIYSGQQLDLLNALGKAFQSAYGIPVKVVRGTDADMLPKVEAENKTGKETADVVAFGDTGWFSTHATMGWFANPTGPAFSDPAFLASKSMTPGTPYFTSTAAVYGIAWNTQSYPKGLKDYTDLLDPKLAGGKIGVMDVRTSPVLVDFYQALEQKYGSDFLQRLAAQKPRIYPSSQPMNQAVISGEISASDFATPLEDDIAKGAPAGFVLAPLVWGNVFNTAIIAKAPHPNAAQLLANFIVTREGQQALARRGASVLPNVPGSETTLDRVPKVDLARLTPAVVSAYDQKWDSLFRNK